MRICLWEDAFTAQATLARQISLNIEISPPPRLYTVLLGESADDRKSTAIKKVVEFFEAAAGDDNVDMIMAGGGFRVCWGIGSAEGLQKSLFNFKSHKSG